MVSQQGQDSQRKPGKKKEQGNQIEIRELKSIIREMRNPGEGLKRIVSGQKK